MRNLSRRGFLRCVGAAAATASIRRGNTAAARKPNILFILVDDMGWRDVGFMGSTYYETPHIDRLAREGVVFTSAYSCGPNCAPTRACLMSGQYTPRHGVYTVGSGARGSAKRRKLVPVENTTTLRSDIVTVAEALKPAGYVSASMGKWHLGNDPELGPVGQGFDANVGGTIAGHPRSYFSPYRNAKLADGPKGEYLTDRLTDEALKFIEANQSRPFFLYLPHYAVHTPIQARKALAEKYAKKTPSQGQGNATYAAMIESVDQGVGRLLAKLDELKLADRTLVVFTSDNGGVGGYRACGIQGGEITSQAPLKGGKGMLYEGGIRVPLAVRWPGRTKPGARCDVPVTSVDFYPTLLEVAAAKRPDQPLDGESIVPLLAGSGTLKRDAIYWHFPAYLQGGGGTWRTTPAGVIRQGDWKLHEFFEDGRLELYNLKEDLGETTDLATRHADKARALQAKLAAWRRELRAPVPTERNPAYDPQARPAGRRETRRNP
ncbi:MAG: sulfatase [Candidatus Brocadiae bacterium]|nr:sulfatase [Candidatus Brocadiia bacterium]